MDDVTASIIVACQTKNAQSSLAGLGNAISKVGFAAGMMAKQMLSFGADCVKAFTVQEDAVDALNDALALKGASQYSKQLQTLASDLQKVTTYGDEATMAAMAQGINLGISADKIGDATKAAMGLAAAYKMDLNTAMMLVGRAAQGQTQMLTRYGIVLDETLSPQEKFNQLLKKGKDYFPLTEADTLSAKLKQMSNAWGDVKESVGQVISSFFGMDDAATGATEILQMVSQYIQDNIENWKIYFAGFRKVVGNVFDNICTFGKNAWEILKLTWERAPEFWGAVWKDIVQTTNDCVEVIRVHFVEWFNMLGKILASFGRNWYDVFKDCAEIVWRSIKSIVIYFVEGIKQIGNLLASLGENFWDLLTGKKTFSEALGSVVDQYIDGWKAVGDKVGEQWNGFEFGKGTKQFAQDTADAANDYATKVGDAARKLGENFGKNTAAFVKDNANLGEYKSVMDGVTDAMIKASKSNKTKKNIAEIVGEKVGGGNQSAQNIASEAAKLPAIRETAASAVSAKSTEGIRLMSRSFVGQPNKNEGINLDKKRNSTLENINNGIQNLVARGATGYSYGS